MSERTTPEGDVQAPDGSLVQPCDDASPHSPHGEYNPEPGQSWWCPGTTTSAVNEMVTHERKTQADFDHQRANGWPDFHPEDYCHRCGMPNICWGTPAEVWNPVMRPEGHDTRTWLWNEIICPICFVQLAQAKCERGIIWELQIEPIPHEGATQFAELVKIYTQEARAKPLNLGSKDAP